MRRMIDIWNERPLIYIEEPEDADKLDAWLEKLKVEYDLLKEHSGRWLHFVAVDYPKFWGLTSPQKLTELKEKAEKWDRFAAEYYEHKWIQDYDNLKDKLEAVMSFLKDTIYDKIWVECRDVEFAKEILTLIEDYNDE